MIEESQLIEVGKLHKPHGYKGEINASFDYPVEMVKTPGLPLFLDVDGIFVPFFIASLRTREGGALIRFDDIESSDDVRPYVNKKIFCLKKDVAAFLSVEEEELDAVADDVIGYDVLTEDERKLGVVSDIQEGTEYDYLIVDPVDEEGEEIMIPFIDDFINEISEDPDGENGTIYVLLPDGYLEAIMENKN